MQRTRTAPSLRGRDAREPRRRAGAAPALAGLALFGALSAAGCAPTTRNRAIQDVDMEGILGGRELARDDYGTVTESHAVDGFASTTLLRHGSDGTVELTLIFEEGTDVLVDHPVEAPPTVDAVVRGRASGSEWEPDVEGVALRVASELLEVEEIDTVDEWGERQTWEIAVVLDFAPPGTDAALLEASPDEPVDLMVPDPTVDERQRPRPEEQVVVRIRYRRDQVHVRRSSRGAYDC